jgi:hypothetical protein
VAFCLVAHPVSEPRLSDCISTFPDAQIEESPAWALHKAQERISALEVQIDRLQGDNKTAWASRTHLMAELAGTEKALKDALALIVYLASRE